MALTLLVALVAAMHVGCERSDQPAPTDGAPAALGVIALTDHDGKARRFSDFEGKIVLLSFFFTSCPSVCPRGAQELSKLQHSLPVALREHVQLLSLSVDPENDTPAAMRQFALENGADLGGWAFVRADAAATRELARELSMFEGPSPAPTPSNHTTAVYLFDAGGRLRQRYAGSPLDVPRLAREVERLEASGRVTSATGRKEAAAQRVTALK